MLSEASLECDKMLAAAHHDSGPADVSGAELRKLYPWSLFSTTTRTPEIFLPTGKKEKNSMASDKVLHVTDDEFDSTVINNDLPCLVDFWAPWCGPCKAIGPVIDELAAEFDGKIVITKMNVDDNPSTPGKFGIRAIPTLILFKGGEVVDKVTGAVGKPQLIELINKAL